MKSVFTYGIILVLAIVALAVSDNSSEGAVDNDPIDVSETVIDSMRRAKVNNVPKALLASRLEDMVELQKVIRLQYYGPTDSFGRNAVRLSYNNGGLVESVLEQGVTQGDIIEVRDGDFQEAVSIVLNDPFAITYRNELNQIYKLSRRRSIFFGEGDVAFFDLAEATVANISTPDLAYLVERDSSEKGFINTFNHVTAQALISTCYGEELAEFIATVHERYHMPELITGEFTEEQLMDPDNNPMDNYVDIINNELGQQLGLWLRDKYQITRETVWTPELLVQYMNDLQSYYSWAFQIGMKPFRADMDLMKRFADKINIVSQGELPYSF